MDLTYKESEDKSVLDKADEKYEFIGSKSYSVVSHFQAVPLCKCARVLLTHTSGQHTTLCFFDGNFMLLALNFECLPMRDALQVDDDDCLGCSPRL